MKCVICGKKISGHGNNAEPVAQGTCCDDCNLKIVVPERIKQVQAEKERSNKNESRKKLAGTRR